MKNILIILLLVVGLASGVFFLGVWGQTETTQRPQKPVEKTKMPDVSPELREKAFGLLVEVIKETENLKLPQNRIQIKIRAADLLWEKDEKQARKVFDEIQNEIKKKLNEIDVSSFVDICYYNDPSFVDICAIWSLQPNLMETLIERDVRIADSIFKTSDVDSQNQKVIKQKIFEKYLEVDSQKAFEIIKQDIGKKPLVDDLFFLNDEPENTGSLGELSKLYQANPELGAKLAKEILKFIEKKTINVQQPHLGNGNYANFANVKKFLPIDEELSNSNYTIPTPPISNSNLNKFSNSITNSRANSVYLNPNDVDFNDVGLFLKLADKIQTENQKRQTTPVPLLTEYEMKGIASLLMESLIAKRRFDYNQVVRIYLQLVKYAPTQIQKLRQQMTATQWKKFESEIQNPRLPFERSRNVGDILHEIETALPEKHDELYAEASLLATNYAQCSVVEDGFGHYLEIKKKEKFTELNKLFADLMQRYKARNGDVKELRKVLTAEKDSMKKAELISQSATALAQKGDVENAKKLFGEAQKLLPPKYKNSPQLRASTVYAGALASLDTNQSFLLLETLISQANETINTTANFYEFSEANGFITNNEFLLDVMEFQSAKHISPSVPMIKKLAQADFERTVKLADKFSRPEVRLFARWHIAESLLNKEAENREKDIADYREGCE